MSKLTLTKLKSLANDMKRNHVDKDRFSFDYKTRFDVIISVVNDGFELLIGLHKINKGLLIKVSPDYVAELKDEAYFNLCHWLNLSYKKEGFTSNKFLILLSEKIPRNYSGYKYTYEDMIPYLKCKPINEAEKIYFKGWNNHIKDHNKARNFEKTEFYFGKEIADYCRKNNISSLWETVSSFV